MPTSARGSPARARSGNEPFGAALTLDDPDDVAAITTFLREGHARAAADPPADT
jgi:hypothetical protein